MFILGAGGFIGRRLVDEALAANWKVKALVRSAEGGQSAAQRSFAATPSATAIGCIICGPLTLSLICVSQKFLHV